MIWQAHERRRSQIWLLAFEYHSVTSGLSNYNSSQHVPYVTRLQFITMTMHHGHASRPFGSKLEQIRGLSQRSLEGLLPIVGHRFPYLQAGSGRRYTHGASNSRLHPSREPWKLRSLLDVRLALIILWILLLWWGEEAVFRRGVKGCAWDRWESWVGTSVPHLRVSLGILISLAAS